MSTISHPKRLVLPIYLLLIKNALTRRCSLPANFSSFSFQAQDKDKDKLSIKRKASRSPCPSCRCP